MVNARKTIFEDVVTFIPTTSEEIMKDGLFSNSLKLHIASALSVLNQNGVGYKVNMFDAIEPTWDDFFGKFNGLETSHAKQYVYTQAQLYFDTPQSNVSSILEKVAKESLWRARLDYDD